MLSDNLPEIKTAEGLVSVFKNRIDVGSGSVSDCRAVPDRGAPPRAAETDHISARSLRSCTPFFLGSPHGHRAVNDKSGARSFESRSAGSFYSPVNVNAAQKKGWAAPYRSRRDAITDI